MVARGGKKKILVWGPKRGQVENPSQNCPQDRWEETAASDEWREGVRATASGSFQRARAEGS